MSDQQGGLEYGELCKKKRVGMVLLEGNYFGHFILVFFNTKFSFFTLTNSTDPRHT